MSGRALRCAVLFIPAEDWPRRKYRCASSTLRTLSIFRIAAILNNHHDSDNNNNPSSSGGGGFPLSSSTVNRSGSVMNSSASTSFAPETDNANEMSLALTGDTAEETTEDVSADVVAIIFSFLSHADIMHARVCTTWREAAKKTIVPPTYFPVDSVRSYNAMRAMATSLPNLQQISIRSLGLGHKYSHGEDADEEDFRYRYTASYTTHDINIISNFSKLRVLEIRNTPLNGRHPSLYNFPHLQSLAITYCLNLKWNLDIMSASFPLLKELELVSKQDLTGNLRSLRVLKHTLKKVDINCERIEGDLMDLADFPGLTVLNLVHTSVTGDVRDIGEYDFSALDSLALPRTVHGGFGYKFHRISDVPDFMHTIHILLQRIPTLFREIWLSRALFWSLSEDSPDWYAGGIGNQSPPFALRFIHVGSRLGWSWCSKDLHTTRKPRHLCEINWLDPEPSSESDDYGAYIEALQRIEGEMNAEFYRGYHEPPTEMEYRRLCEGLEQRD
eukprot:scaffold15094_cov223-Skeletonema_dohrnii-CCMP3373.AAC.4